MHGQLGVESTYGQGSTFWVRIPQKVVDPTPCGPYRDGEQRENNRNYNSFTAPEAVVLVVDDQPLNLKVCQGLLGPYEMEVYTARSGQEALRQMTQVWPDLVLMDHMMPGMDGVEATARIREMGRKDPYFAVVPIVALTANAMKGVREEFLQKGFNDFLPKPIELDKLDNVLRAWIPEDKQKAPAPALGTWWPSPSPRTSSAWPGIDVARGMSYCGTGQVYRKTLLPLPGADPRPPAADPEGPGDRAVGGLRHRGPQPEERRPVDRRHGPGGPRPRPWRWPAGRGTGRRSPPAPRNSSASARPWGRPWPS